MKVTPEKRCNHTILAFIFWRKMKSFLFLRVCGIRTCFQKCYRAFRNHFAVAEFHPILNKTQRIYVCIWLFLNLCVGVSTLSSNSCFFTNSLALFIRNLYIYIRNLCSRYRTPMSCPAYVRTYNDYPHTHRYTIYNEI